MRLVRRAYLFFSGWCQVGPVATEVVIWLPGLIATKMGVSMMFLYIAWPWLICICSSLEQMKYERNVQRKVPLWAFPIDVITILFSYSALFLLWDLVNFPIPKADLNICLHRSRKYWEWLSNTWYWFDSSRFKSQRPLWGHNLSP